MTIRCATLVPVLYSKQPPLCRALPPICRCLPRPSRNDVSDPLPNRNVETDTLPLRGRGCVPEQEAAKAPTHPGCSDESVIEDGIASGNTTPIRTWPPRWKTESDTL